MRKAFVASLVELAHQDERIVLLTADLGFMVLEPFRDAFPDRFFNVGVMEQEMIGIATGLAMNGFIPYVYSITTFATLRCYEFIRNGPALHNLPVRIVGIGTGVDYAFDGLSHFALEDLALMRTLPNLGIISPADSVQAANAVKATWDLPQPIYYRLSKNDALSVPKLNGAFTYGEIDLIKQGKDCVIISTGSLTSDTYQAAVTLEQNGIHCAVVVVSTIQPLNPKQIVHLLSGYKYVFTCEPALAQGGLGSLMSEIVTTNNLGCEVIRMGLAHTMGDRVGSQTFLHIQKHVTAEDLIRTITAKLKY